MDILAKQQSRALNVITITGDIDNESDFAKFKLGDLPNIEFDLSGVRHVNSHGLRAWISWISKLDRGKNYAIRNCPSVMINLANIIQGLFPEWIRIKTIELPYFCEPCAKGFSHFRPPNDVPKEMKCEACGQAAELDVVPARYFQFLKQR